MPPPRACTQLQLSPRFARPQQSPRSAQLQLPPRSAQLQLSPRSLATFAHHSGAGEQGQGQGEDGAYPLVLEDWQAVRPQLRVWLEAVEPPVDSAANTDGHERNDELTGSLIPLPLPCPLPTPPYPLYSPPLLHPPSSPLPNPQMSRGSTWSNIPKSSSVPAASMSSVL